MGSPLEHPPPSRHACASYVPQLPTKLQLVWGPGMTLVFFAFLKTLEGRPDLILHTVSAG